MMNRCRVAVASWRTNRPFFATAIVLAALLSTPSKSQAVPAPNLAGSNWVPVQLGSLTVPEGMRASVRFGTDGKLTGRGGCNRFFGAFVTSGDALAIGPIGSTKMACRGSPMETEGAFFEALKNTATFEISDTSLRLFDSAGGELARLTQSD